jgi:hypothetical protein
MTLLNLLRGFARALRTAEKSFWWAFGVALAVWAVAGAALLMSTDSVINNAHYIAALCLVVCIFGVGVVNARRYRDKQAGAATNGQTKDRADTSEPDARAKPEAADDGLDKAATYGPAGLRSVPAAVARYRYTAIAWAMLLATPAVFILWWPLELITLFWLEIFVATLFVAFWVVQTIELLPPRGPGRSARSSP